MATFGTSSVAGPVIGGLLAGTSTILGVAGWRWVFLVNVPIGILALAVVFKTLHVHHEKHSAKVDWQGAGFRAFVEIEKRAGLRLGQHDVFLNIAGGLRLEA